MDGEDRQFLRKMCIIIWKKMSKKKLVITREVSAENKVYSKADMVVFSVSCTLGVNLWNTSTLLATYGGTVCYSYMLNGLVQLVSLLCYTELTAMQPCLGGPYHYAYNNTGELVAFLVGWMMLGYLFATTAKTFQIGSYLIDQTFFNGLIAESERTNFDNFIPNYFFSSAVWNNYFDVIPLLLSISFSGIAAAEPNDSKMINIGVFFLALCLQNCLVLILVGNAEIDMWMKHAHAGTIITSFKDVSTSMSAVYALLFFGEESEHPKKDIPSAIFWSFFITWFWFSIFPTVVFLNGRGINFKAPTLLIDILKAKHFDGLSFAPALGVTCAVYSSCFVELLTTVKVILAMSRDGLMPKVFSKVVHFNRMPVKPTFLVGAIIGFVAVIFKNKFLSDVSTTIYWALLVMGPVLLLKQRYLYTIIHIGNQVRRSRRPSPYAGIAVYIATAAFLFFGDGVYHALTPYLIHPNAVHDDNYMITIYIFGSLSGITFIFLCFQPQSYPTMSFKIYGVPYIPLLSIMTYGFIFQYVAMERFASVLCWVILGIVWYIVNSKLT